MDLNLDLNFPIASSTSLIPSDPLNLKNIVDNWEIIDYFRRDVAQGKIFQRKLKLKKFLNENNITEGDLKKKLNIENGDQLYDLRKVL